MAEARIYWRDRGGTPRAYGDFRAYSDVGGKREPLIPEGLTAATDDEAIAAKLFADRLEGAGREAPRPRAARHQADRHDQRIGAAALA